MKFIFELVKRLNLKRFDLQVPDEQPVCGVHVRVLVLRVAHVPGAEGNQ